MTSADSTFAFADVNLNPGSSNVWQVIASDGAGNRSRPSASLVVVRHDPPAAPEDLTAAAVGNDVDLSWSALPAPDSTGFRISRDGAVVNETVQQLTFDGATHTVTASSGPAGDWLAPLDSDPLTGWQGDEAPTPSAPAFWQWTWPAAELEEITVTWDNALLPSSFEVDIQADGDWLWWATFPTPTLPTTILAAEVEATGIRIRLRETGCPWPACAPTLVEVSASTVTRTTASPYADQGLTPGAHHYDLSQVNRWGQQSPSATAVALVDVAPPAPPPGSHRGRRNQLWHPCHILAGAGSGTTGPGRFQDPA